MRLRASWLTAVLLLATGCSTSMGDKPPEVTPPRSTAASTAGVATTPVTAVQEVTDQVEVEVTSGLTVLPADQAQEMFVRVRLRGLPLATEKRPSLNLALAVDTSGSMEGPGIERVREACAALVEKLGDGDSVSIVTFGSTPKVILDPVVISKETRLKAKSAIAGMVADGTTDMAGGLKVALDQVRSRHEPNAIQRVVLVGDGVPNDPGAVSALANVAASWKIPVTTLGVGADFEETLMAQVANTSGGTFHFVDEASEVAKVFDQELTKLKRIAARGTSVEIIPGPGVVVHEVLGLQHGFAGRNVRFHIGDLAEGQVRDAILRVSLGKHKDGTKVEVLDAIASYQHGVAQKPLVARDFASLKSTADKAVTADGRVPEVEHQGVRIQVAANLVNAIALARAGDVKGARALLDKTAKLAKEAGDRFADDELKARAKEATSLKKTVASLAPPPQPIHAQPTFGGVGAGKPTPAAPTPAALTPSQAKGLRSVHGDAMKTIQGL